MSETAIAFARWYLCGIETAITFAGAKSVFFGAVFGRSGVVGFKVATLLRLVREKVRPAWPDVCVSAKKFALHAQNTLKSAFLRLLGEFFAEVPVEGRCWANFFAEMRLEGRCWANFFVEMRLKGLCWASFFAPIGPAPRSCRRRGARGWLRWGFCSIRSWLAACRRRVVPLMTPFPPFGDGPAAPSAASARAPSRWTSPQRVRRRSSTTTSSRRRRNMSAALNRLKQQNEPE